MRIYYVAYEGSQSQPQKIGVWLRYSALGLPVSCIIQKTVSDPSKASEIDAECKRIAKHLQTEYNKTQTLKLF